MGIESLTSVKFDRQDLDLFKVDNKDLKIKAVRNSIIPRMLDILHSALAEIQSLYGVDPLEVSSISFSPNSLSSRGKDGEFTYDVRFARVSVVPKIGMVGEGVERRMRRFRDVRQELSLILSSAGIGVCVSAYQRNRKGITIERVRKFLIENEHVFLPLLNITMGYVTLWNDEHPHQPGLRDVFPLKNSLGSSVATDYWELGLRSQWFSDAPISEKFVRHVARLIVMFYPFYHCVLMTSEERKCDFEGMVRKACQWRQQTIEKLAQGAKVSSEASDGFTGNIDEIVAVAEKQVRVMPGMRWQVFERDNWKCVACGKTVEEGARLEVDHIVPRSKGGKDELSNFQTLCKECNIGKSNKNQTDLRRR